MTNKDQLIQEMASDMDYATIQHDLWPDDAKEIAKTLIMLGYRKIPTDSTILSTQEYLNTVTKIREEFEHEYKDKDGIVLSREEYENYKKVADGKAIMVENITDLNRLVQFPIEYDGKLFDGIADFGNYIDDQARKETVKEILDRIDSESYGQTKQITDLLRKQYDVEVNR